MYLLSTALAQITNPALGSLGNMSAEAFIDGLLSGLISLGLVIGGVVFLFMLIIGGIQWITSGGDKVANESARRRVTNALIGVFLLFSLYGIVNLVSCFFGVDLLKIDIGPFSVSFGSNPFCEGAFNGSNGNGSNGNGSNGNGSNGNGGTCSPPCNSPYWCSTAVGVSECCRCVRGDQPGAFGPVECCSPPGGVDCRIYIVQGCSP